MRFEKIEIDPRKNPAVLDTATWEPASAWSTVSAIDESHWNSVAKAVREDHPLPVDERCIVYAGSCAEYQASVFFLAGLADGQHVFIQLGTDDKDTFLEKTIGTRSLKDETRLAVYCTDAAVIDRAKRVIEAARHYTFFTLDVSDILDYGAMNVSSESAAQEYLANHICQPKQRNEVVAYHSQRCFAEQQYQPDKAAIGRLIGKYWPALNAVEQLSNHIRTVRNEVPFDLELSIDETPSGVDAFTCLTTESELMFLMLELQRRGIPVTHIAPNFGIEKGLDYRGRDGLVGLEKRIQGLCDISRQFGLMLDCHSGDDLKSATRQAVGRATQGHIHFKVSPALQVIFAETMKDVEPERFRFWWDDTLDYARREAEAGSDFAAKCLRRYEAGDNRERSPEHAVFHYYNFASVGKRDRKGQFVHREKFYDMSADFYHEYQRRICSYLCEVAADLFNRT